MDFDDFTIADNNIKFQRLCFQFSLGYKIGFARKRGTVEF
jgi:hypothetical protein